jgi:hypothetical protein
MASKRTAVLIAASVGLAGVLAAWLVVSRADSISELPDVSSGTQAPPSCPPELDGDFGGPHGAAVWEWYRTRLTRMGEPILACGPTDDDETYRITWVHAFTTYSPIAVRLFRTNQSRRLTAARYTWKVPRPELAAVARVERELSEGEWTEVHALVRSAGFWAMPGAFGDFGNDGATWMLEGRRGLAYHLVTKWSPDHGPFRDLAMHLVRLAGFDDPELRGQ